MSLNFRKKHVFFLLKFLTRLPNFMFAFVTKFSDENSITHANGYRFRLSYESLQAEASYPNLTLGSVPCAEQPLGSTLGH